jgi:hypothetical protein
MIEKSGMAYIIADEVFNTKADVIHRAQSILDDNHDPRRLTGQNLAFILELLGHHESSIEKVGPGIKALWIKKAPVFGNRCFWIERIDGTWTDFSIKKCITGFPPSTILSSVMRRAIADQLGTLGYKSVLVYTDYRTITHA